MGLLDVIGAGIMLKNKDKLIDVKKFYLRFFIFLFLLSCFRVFLNDFFSNLKSLLSSSVKNISTTVPRCDFGIFLFLVFTIFIKGIISLSHFTLNNYRCSL